MPPRKNLSGQVFGKWIITDQWKREKDRTYWYCRCACKTESWVQASNLRSGRSTQCASCSAEQVGVNKRTHGHTVGRKTSNEYYIWRGIKKRCFNPKDTNYRHYGAKGIGMDPEWRKSFEDFLKDMGPRPSKRHQIDRIDNDGNYEPNNCRWATPKENSRNKGNNHTLTFGGVTMTLAEWADLTGINYTTLHWRSKNGWPIDKILSPTKQ